MVNIWDVQTAALLYKLPGHSGAVTQVAFHPHEPIVASCGTDMKIYLGEVKDY
jgi:Prp8 binding protein